MKILDKWKIEQWDGTTGNLVREYPSIQYTAYKLDIAARTIRESIKQGKSDYRGYIWKKKSG